MEIKIVIEVENLAHDTVVTGPFMKSRVSRTLNVEKINTTKAISELIMAMEKVMLEFQEGNR